MVDKIKTADLDWYRNKFASEQLSVSAPLRGNMAIVSYMLKKGEAYGAYRSQKTRCIWPDSLLNSRSRFLSRRVVAKVI